MTVRVTKVVTKITVISSADEADVEDARVACSVLPEPDRDREVVEVGVDELITRLEDVAETIPEIVPSWSEQDDGEPC